MRGKTILILLALAGLCWLSAPVASAAARSGGQAVIDVVLLEKRIHALVNQERKKAGLPTLEWSHVLQGIARGHSRDMATRHFFSHNDPEGHDFKDRYRQAGFTCSVRAGFLKSLLGGENLAWNTLGGRNGRTEEQLAATVVRLWMESPGHRRNILTRHFRREGIGVFIGADGKVLTTQNFC